MPTLVEPRRRTRLPGARDAIETRTLTPAGLALGLIAVGIGLAIVALLGPLAAVCDRQPRSVERSSASA